MTELEDIPRIISVDDHVLEPPTMWIDRVPSKYHDIAPRVERQRIHVSEKQVGGQMKFVWEADDNAPWVDVWRYEDLSTPLMLPNAAIGFDELAFLGVTFDQVAPGAWQSKPRLEDMDANHVEASLCFPNTLPRFCGQAFLEAKDRDLAALCVRAYNDWLIEDWCAGEAVGRLLPVIILPLWSVEDCLVEIRRNVDRGCNAITFPENPYPLGLPSLHTDHWNPVFELCQELGVVVCMHIGSSSKMPTTTPDAPWIVSSTLTFQNGLMSLVDFIFSGILERYPTMKIAYSEAQVGWMPYVLERADKIWAERSNNSFGHNLPHKPSEYIAGRVYGCIFDDETGLRNRDVIGIDQICFETDYPHADSTFPHSKKVLADIAAQAGLSDEELYKLARGNAIQLFDLGRFGLK